MGQCCVGGDADNHDQLEALPTLEVPLHRASSSSSTLKSLPSAATADTTSTQASSSSAFSATSSFGGGASSGCLLLGNLSSAAAVSSSFRAGPTAAAAAAALAQRRSPSASRLEAEAAEAAAAAAEEELVRVRAATDVAADACDRLLRRLCRGGEAEAEARERRALREALGLRTRAPHARSFLDVPPEGGGAAAAERHRASAARHRRRSLSDAATLCAVKLRAVEDVRKALELRAGTAGTNASSCWAVPARSASSAPVSAATTPSSAVPAVAPAAPSQLHQLWEESRLGPLPAKAQYSSTYADIDF